MTFDSRNRPTFGSTDWAAQQFMRMLDREERHKKTRAGSGPDPSGAFTQTAQSPEETAVQAEREFTPERRRALIDAIIGTEGGYVNSSGDPGGPTNYGITEDIINDFNIGRPADQQFTTPIDQITRDQAASLYDWFISKFKLDRINNPDFRAQVIDMAINMGIENTGRLLLGELGDRGYDVGRDGLDPTSPLYNVIGSRTRGVLNRLEEIGDDAELRAINNALVRRRLRTMPRTPISRRRIVPPI